MPSYSIQFRRGTATDHSSFTGEFAEITVDITNNRIILHDGETPGGIPIAKLSDVPVDVGDLSDDLTHIAAANSGGGGIGAISSLSFVRSGASGATNPFQLKMSSDGTIATWAIGGIGAGSDQYTLSTAWDFSTATKTTSNSTKIIPSGYAANYTSNQMAFSNDGNSLYVNAGVAGGTDRSIFQYNMSSPWSLSTASYANKSFTFTHGTIIGDLIFNNDGSKMYIPRRISGTEFYQYSLSSAYDITTATDDGITFDPGVELGGLAFNADGTYLYAIYDPGDTNYIKQWSLSTPYDLNTATAGTDVLLGDATTEAAPTGLAFGNDQLHVSGQQFDNVRTYDIS